ncbi:MAG: 3-isopropylmalate dehydratase small subunit [Bacillota bacterium]
MEIIKGRAFKFGDNIDTDQIYPGRFLDISEHSEIAEHAMEGIDPDFTEKIAEGDIIVVGNNFGCGSSREHAVITLKEAGISAVIASSFARIFYRNAINLGLPVIEIKGMEVKEKKELTIDINNSKIINDSGEEYNFIPFPEQILEILESGGIINYYKNNLEG